MPKNSHSQKVIFSFNNFTNKSFNDYINAELKKENHFLYTKNKVAKQFFPKHKIIIAQKHQPSFLENFSNFKLSSVETFYLIKSLFDSYLIKKVLIMFKLIFGYLNLLPTKDRLRKQNYFVKKNLRDLDLLYCDFRLNEIYTNHELNHFAKKNNKKIICFIFSWDNLFAGDINKYADLYYVSSNYFKSILTDRHKIQKYKIKIGSNFQLKYFKLKKRKKNYSKYIIYAFSHSYLEKKYFAEEIAILKYISSYIYSLNKNIKILVRFYPYDFNNNYKEIKNLRNVTIQKYGKKYFIDKKKNFVYENNLSEKLSFIKNSICVINVFTTFGIEAAILNKPTIFYSLNKNQNFKSNINSINFKLKFMPHFQIIKNKIVRPRNNTELFNLLNSILRGKYEKKFYLQSKSLKKVFL